MRIAQVAPLEESVPPKGYGGTERVVSYLTEELVDAGHEVTLFASGDSSTTAELIPMTPQSLRLDEGCSDPLAHHTLMLQHVIDRADAFDVVHFHIDYLHFPISRQKRWRHVTTLHGRLDIPDLQPLYERYANLPLISISSAQRDPLKAANWIDTVYHGLPENLYEGRDEPGSYLAFLGRISPEKRVDRAIEISSASGIPLKIAAKIGEEDRTYFEQEIEPLFDRPNVEHVGEIGEEDKNDFLGNARALLFPIDWPEPFGLAMIEALACGTPVIAYPRGAVPEIVKDGTAGFIVESISEAVEAVKRSSRLKGNRCRQYFESRFTAKRMMRDYLTVYQKLLSSK